MGGTTVPPPSNIAEEHPAGERGTGATVVSSGSGDRADPSGDGVHLTSFLLE